jgi:hypothetical protein
MGMILCFYYVMFQPMKKFHINVRNSLEIV